MSVSVEHAFETKDRLRLTTCEQFLVAFCHLLIRLLPILEYLA